MGLLHSGLMILRVHHSKHFVVIFVDVQLHWVLVVRKQRVMSVGQVGESTALMIKEEVGEKEDQRNAGDLRYRRSSRLAISST